MYIAESSERIENRVVEEEVAYLSPLLSSRVKVFREVFISIRQVANIL